MQKWLVALSLLLGSGPVLSAGQWAYRCDFIHGPVSCDQVADEAAKAVPPEFISQYPGEAYVVNFTIQSSFFVQEKIQTYLAVASLHKKVSKEGQIVEFPSMAAHSHSGFDGRNPTYALQRENILRSVRFAMGALVSDLMDR